MSRIGKKIIEVPKGVEVTVAGDLVSVKGPKGKLSHKVHPTMVVVKDAGTLKVEPRSQEEKAGNFHGLTRSLINNMVEGVVQGFTKTLVLKGVGYRAATKGRELQLTLGFSHPVNYEVPEGLDIKVDKQTNIIITGADKQLVGKSAAEIRAYRAPEPYHGKGIRYENEVIETKAGKASGKK